MLANDDLHGDPENPKGGRYDWYQGWTMARVKERRARGEAPKYAKFGPEPPQVTPPPTGYLRRVERAMSTWRSCPHPCAKPLIWAFCAYGYIIVA